MDKKYVKEAKKTLKAMFKLYDELKNDVYAFSRSDDVLSALDSAIFSIGCSICPSDCCSIDDFRDWLNG